VKFVVTLKPVDADPIAHVRSTRVPPSPLIRSLARVAAFASPVCEVVVRPVRSPIT
jgi:hypothetical protein